MTSCTPLCLLAAFLWAGSIPSSAEVVWRVSVKLILDSGGQRPGSPAITDGQIQVQFDFANTNPYVAGRGIRLANTEIVQVSPPASASQDWFRIDLAPDTVRSALETEAKGDPAYAWRTDAINIYINQGTGGGSASFPSSGGSIIVIGARKAQLTPWVFLHEIGHFMSLYHTHQGQNCLDDDQDNCSDCPNPRGGNDDRMADTLADHRCFDQDDIAVESFASRYAAASTTEREQVDNTFFNIMSYHANRSILTTLQLDAMCDTSNGARDVVTQNNFVFVDAATTASSPTGSSRPVHILDLPPVGGPFPRLAEGLDAAGAGDVVLLRPGSYVESREIRQPITLRAIRHDTLVAGNAVIRAR